MTTKWMASDSEKEFRTEAYERDTSIEVQLIPLERFAEPIFDFSQLPFAITDGVEAADVSQIMPPSDFAYMEAEVGRYLMRYFNSTVKFGLVHKYALPILGNDEANKEKTELLNKVFALLRIIRPHTRLGGARGTITNGKAQFNSLTWPHGTIDVPEAVKLFSVRNKDLVELRSLLPTFIKAMRGPYWPFRMAVQYYYMGYEQNDWKGRYLGWGSSALHALYSHKDQKIIPRVKAFLGDNTLIYEPTEHPEYEFLEPNTLTIGDVLEDVNEVRHDIAHGDKIPDRFFTPGGGRPTLGGFGNYIAVLDDALSFIIRETLLKILRKDLIEDFRDRHQYTQYWKTLGV
ncbi:MAG TPA: hypothetical protein VN875_09130 [Candidatus Binatus sp.]|nr:hypothetical protein [Candidatus Binatus sp.]